MIIFFQKGQFIDFKKLCGAFFFTHGFTLTHLKNTLFGVKKTGIKTPMLLNSFENSISWPPSALVAWEVNEGVNLTADSFYSSQGRMDPAFNDENGELMKKVLEKYPKAITMDAGQKKRIPLLERRELGYPWLS